MVRNEAEEGSIEINATTSTGTRTVAPEQYLDELFLFLGMMGKQHSEDYFKVWFDKRRQAVNKGKVIQYNVTRTRTAAVIRKFWEAMPRMRAMLLKSYLQFNHPEGYALREKLIEIKSNLTMILSWAEMKLFHECYLYVTTMQPKLLRNPEFWTQSKHVVDTYNRIKLAEPHLTPYARLLNKTTDDVNNAKYPDVAYATWYYLTNKKYTWEQFAQPKHPTNLALPLLEDDSLVFAQGYAQNIVVTDEQREAMRTAGINVDNLLDDTKLYTYRPDVSNRRIDPRNRRT